MCLLRRRVEPLHLVQSEQLAHQAAPALGQVAARGGEPLRFELALLLF